MGDSPNGWFIMEIPDLKWMISGYPHCLIYGNLHMCVYVYYLFVYGLDTVIWSHTIQFSSHLKSQSKWWQAQHISHDCVTIDCERWNQVILFWNKTILNHINSTNGQLVAWSYGLDSWQCSDDICLDSQWDPELPHLKTGIWSHRFETH